MRRMFSLEQLIKLIKENGLTQEQVIALLVGKYVRIMDAPTSTTLTDEQIAQIQEGAFIEGTFLGYINPVLFPSPNSVGGYLHGTLYGIKSGALSPEFKPYRISTSSKVISVWTGSTSYGIDIFVSNINGYPYPVAGLQNNVNSGDTIENNSDLDKALKAHREVEINGHRCRFESEETSGESTYIIYSSFGEVSATGKLTANIISYNKSSREISFNQMTFTPDA